MRRRRWFKPLAGLLAVWFPLVAGEPGLLRVCPAHSAAAAHGAGRHAGMANDGRHTAQMPAGDAGAAAPDQPPSPGHQHHECACISCCCASAAAFVASCAPDLRVAAPVPRSAVAIRTYNGLARPAPEYSRPHSTGPPADLAFV